MAHAAVAAVLATARSRDFRAWLEEGQPKVVLRAGSEEELLGIVAKAIEAGLHAELIRDAGRTQLEPGHPHLLRHRPGRQRQDRRRHRHALAALEPARSTGPAEGGFSADR